MTVIGRSPARWVAAGLAMAALVGGGGMSALASPAEQPTIPFSFSDPLEQHAAIPNLAPAPLVSPQHLPLPVTYAVCSESDTWSRPTSEAQSNQLQSNPRYGSVPPETAQMWLQRFWEKDVIAFTTYGLSARQEPIYFSGLWSLFEQVPVWDQCYDAERISQINQGQLAELWLIGHQIKSIQWVSDRYVITVEPTELGAQFIQFPRRESFAALPLQIVTSDNVPLDFVSADPALQL